MYDESMKHSHFSVLLVRQLFLFLLLPLFFARQVPTLPAQEAAEGVLGVVNPIKDGMLPADAGSLGKQAAAAFSNKDWPGARRAYREMLELEPTNALAWANLGAVEQQSGDLNAAIDSFERAVSFNPALVQSWIALGLAYDERGDHYRALSALSRAVHEDPMDARAHNYLALVGNRFGWLSMAQAELERAIQLRPDYAVAHFNLALTYLEQKPPALELARRHYEEARELGIRPDEVVERKLKQEKDEP
jgi:tetratricopeptide (TPR) repeat protein